MTRKLLCTAVLLSNGFASMAAAADLSEHQSQTARKLLANLNSVGINNKDVQNFVSETATHVDLNYFYIGGQDTGYGYVMLRYQLNNNDLTGSQNTSRKLEFHYSQEDSPLEITARTNGIMLGYSITFK